jgi:hypothetical protein
MNVFEQNEAFLQEIGISGPEAELLSGNFKLYLAQDTSKSNANDFNGRKVIDFVKEGLTSLVEVITALSPEGLTVTFWASAADPTLYEARTTHIVSIDDVEQKLKFRPFGNTYVAPLLEWYLNMALKVEMPMAVMVTTDGDIMDIDQAVQVLAKYSRDDRLFPGGKPKIRFLFVGYGPDEAMVKRNLSELDDGVTAKGGRDIVGFKFLKEFSVSAFGPLVKEWLVG